MFDTANKVMRVGTIKRNKHQSINVELYYIVQIELPVLG